MRITPVKPVSSWRLIWMRLRLWKIAIRMKELHGNPDVWFTESTSPKDGSPWALTHKYANTCGASGPTNVIHAVKAEAEFRFESMQDFFAGMQSVMRTRQAYSLYVLSRSAIEASAFATWVYDPDIEPEERLLRGLLLRAEHLEHEIRAVNTELRDGHTTDASDQDYLADVTSVKKKVDRAVQQTHTDLQSRTMQPSTALPSVPSKTRRVREMLLEDMGLPMGSDAYHRLSGIAHSQALAIADIWNLSKSKPFIDYFNFLVYLDLAVRSIDFSLNRRAVCWGESYKGTRIKTITRNLDRILSSELLLLLSTPIGRYGTHDPLPDELVVYDPPYNWCEIVKDHNRSGRYDEALVILDGCMRVEEFHDGGVAPWYYEQAAIIHRKRGDRDAEIAVLRRFAAQSRAAGVKPPKLLERLAELEATSSK